MDVEELKDPEAVAQRLAAVMAARIEAGVRQVVLAGGTTPMRAHELLGPMVADWSGVQLWFGDERCVEPDDDECNFKQAAERLQAPGATWHRMRGELGPQAGAGQYAEELGDTPLELLVLGMGPDGHTASLAPDDPALDAGGSVIGVTGFPKPPPERITLTLERINAADVIVLAATGEEKAGPLRQVLDGPHRSVPASLLARDKLLVIADAAALG